MDEHSLDELISSVQNKPDGAEETPTLTGDDLLSIVRENAHIPKDELLSLCGYYTVKDNGKRSYRYTEFYQALIEAQGITLQPPTITSRRGRELPYKVTCQKSGNVLIGSAYTTREKFKTGDRFRVQVLDGSIKLTPVSQ